MKAPPDVAHDVFVAVLITETVSAKKLAPYTNLPSGLTVTPCAPKPTVISRTTTLLLRYR